MSRPKSGDFSDSHSELARRLEQTFRLLGKRVYLPSIRRLSAAHRGLDRASVPLLGLLEEHDEVRPTDLATALELDPSTISRQLRHLELLGMVSRSADQQDGRASRIGLTVQGRASLAAVREHRAGLLDDVFRGWPDADRQQLLILLDRLLAGLAPAPSPSHTEAQT